MMKLSCLHHSSNLRGAIFALLRIALHCQIPHLRQIPGVSERPSHAGEVMFLSLFKGGGISAFPELLLQFYLNCFG